MIRTSVMQEDKPDEITKDSRGKEIKLGVEVAFNKAGKITVGIVMSFSQRWRATRPGTGKTKWWALYFEMKIDPEDGGTPSRIKNPNSFIIL